MQQDRLALKTAPFLVRHDSPLAGGGGVQAVEGSAGAVVDADDGVAVADAAAVGAAVADDAVAADVAVAGAVDVDVAVDVAGAVDAWDVGTVGGAVDAAACTPAQA